MNVHSNVMNRWIWFKERSGWQKAPEAQRRVFVVLLVLVASLYILAASDWRVTHNSTHSISYKFILARWHHIPKRDQLIIFHNPRQIFTEYSSNTRWIKFLRGLPGDKLEIIDRKVYVNGQLVGLATAKNRDGSYIEPLHFSGIIPPHKYLAMGTAPESFDSRYEGFGLINEDEILATGYPIF